MSRLHERVRLREPHRGHFQGHACRLQGFHGTDVGQPVGALQREDIMLAGGKFVGAGFGLSHGQAQIGEGDALAFLPR
jgi:hypothetical protein